MILPIIIMGLLGVHQVNGMCESVMDDCCPQPGITMVDCPSRQWPIAECCEEYYFDGTGPQQWAFEGECPYVIRFWDVNIPDGTVLKVGNVHCKDGCKVAHIDHTSFDNFHIRVNGGTFYFHYSGTPPTFKWQVIGKGCSCAEGCEPGWKKFQGICYRVIQCPANWDTQKANCISLGAQMIPIKDAATMAFIDSFSGKHTFIGMRTFDGGNSFKFCDGTYYDSSLGFWDVGEPVLNLNRDCAETSADGSGLSTENCNAYARAICCKAPEET